ncbi:MAG TPA: ABC transporter permease [Candidatus Krumholzibacteria bacterium]|nr:ABC transporter permease [Candidatus Krumholzibacteria bacterium]
MNRRVASCIIVLVQKEILEARRNRWVLLYAGAFAVLSLALSWLGLSRLSAYGLSGFGRTAASMINLIMLTIPLMGLTLGATSLAGERERGTLLLMASQPLSRFEVMAGKFLGLGAAIVAALLVGFGVSGALIAYYGSTLSAGEFAGFVGSSLMLALASLAIGIAIGSLVRRSEAALGISLLVWLAMVFLGDLGLIGGSVLWNPDTRLLFNLALLNPLQAFKISAVLSIRGSLDVLGPTGTWAVRSYGPLLPVLLAGSLAMWSLLGFGFSYWTFHRRGAV